MLHEIIDLFALVVALLGLIPLWRNKQKRLLATAASCLLLVAAGYVIWEYFSDQRAKIEAEEIASKQLSEAEQTIMNAVCRYPTGMGFDEIYERYVDYGSQDWALTDQAFGDLVTKGALTIETKSIPSWNDKGRTVPLRIWRVTNPASCQKPQK